MLKPKIIVGYKKPKKNRKDNLKNSFREEVPSKIIESTKMHRGIRGAKNLNLNLNLNLAELKTEIKQVETLKRKRGRPRLNKIDVAEITSGIKIDMIPNVAFQKIEKTKKPLSKIILQSTGGLLACVIAITVGLQIGERNIANSNNNNQVNNDKINDTSDIPAEGPINIKPTRTIITPTEVENYARRIIPRIYDWSNGGGTRKVESPVGADVKRAIEKQRRILSSQEGIQQKAEVIAVNPATFSVDPETNTCAVQVVGRINIRTGTREEEGPMWWNCLFKMTKNGLELEKIREEVK